MTRPAALIAAELGALLAEQPDALALLRDLIASLVTLQSRDASRDEEIETRRAADRARQKAKRIKDAAAKQTMGDASSMSRDTSSDRGLSACDLLPSVSSSEAQGSKEVVVVRQARARGTRLTTGTEIATENRYFAAAAGIPEGEIDRVWAEFIDYWIAVPGARGTKLNWDATWRNRVRALTPWKGRQNGTGPRGGGGKGSPASDFFAGLAQVAANIGGDDPVAGGADPDIPRGRVEIDG